MTLQERATDAGVAAGWIGWLIARLELVNGMLQTILLVLSIIATSLVILKHWRKRHRFDKSDNEQL